MTTSTRVSVASYDLYSTVLLSYVVRGCCAGDHLMVLKPTYVGASARLLKTLNTKHVPVAGAEPVRKYKTILY